MTAKMIIGMPMANGWESSLHAPLSRLVNEDAEKYQRTKTENCRRSNLQADNPPEPFLALIEGPSSGRSGI